MTYCRTFMMIVLFALSAVAEVPRTGHPVYRMSFGPWYTFPEMAPIPMQIERPKVRSIGYLGATGLITLDAPAITYDRFRELSR